MTRGGEKIKNGRLEYVLHKIDFLEEITNTSSA